MNGIETAVLELLTKNGITFDAAYVREKKNAFGDDRSTDEWRCEFTNSAKPNEPEEFEFFTGLGLRAKATEKEKKAAKWDFPGVTQNDITRQTLWGRRYLAKVESLRKPQAPSAASVLHSLILDSSASEQSFESWCGDFGYDTDSRKAFSIYEACQKNAEKLDRVIPRALREQLAELLQEY